MKNCFKGSAGRLRGHQPGAAAVQPAAGSQDAGGGGEQDGHPAGARGLSAAQEADQGDLRTHSNRRHLRRHWVSSFNIC